MIKQQPEKPQVAVDIVVFTLIKNKLSILLIRRGIKPFKGQWALPGGRVNKNEPLEHAAARELEEETGVKDIYPVKSCEAGAAEPQFNRVYLEQLYTFGEPFRDPRGRVISIAYFALTGEAPEVRPDTDAQAAKWFSIKKLPHLGFDHDGIVSYALKRLRWKLEYTNIASNLLPRHFSLSELQKVYEIILGKKLDKRNFQKKIFSLNLIKPIGKKKQGVPYRPPQLWRFSSQKQVILTKRELVF